jgi:hypothetical protein
MTERKAIRPFNPSNRPDTCLYCGVGLKYTVFSEQRYARTVSLCCQAPVRQDYGVWEGSWGGQLACSACNRVLVGDTEDTETVEHVTPERRSRDKGYGGYFCTRDCGYRFGLLAAEKGVRYTKRPADPAGVPVP